MTDSSSVNPELVEGEDYYLENGLVVFTARYHLRRGYCCDSGCRHCPYNEPPVKKKLSDLFKKILGTDSKHCESCGQPFQCGANLKGCWCADVELTDATRRSLQSKFTNCLCRACLEKLAVENKHE